MASCGKIFLASLLDQMCKRDASDLYLTVSSPPRLRINGEVEEVNASPIEEGDLENLLVELMPPDLLRKFSQTLEANFAMEDSKRGRFRFNVFKQRGSIGIVVRRIKTVIPALHELGLPDVFEKLALEKRGLVLVVGPTGCGKSTTLASMIDYRNSRLTGHIISVEDPIEYVHKHKRSIVTQREIGIDTHSYHTALKNCLRQAPDVIVIGEIRDVETMESAIAFSETGHLCIATLHATNTYQALDRIINFFPAERMSQVRLDLSLNLRAITSQRLIPKKEGGGRIPAVEVMLNTPRIADMLYKGEFDGIKEAMEKSGDVGMKTFDQSLYELYRQGFISLEEALKNADSENNLRLKIKLEASGDASLDQKSLKKGRNVTVSEETTNLILDS